VARETVPMVCDGALHIDGNAAVLVGSDAWRQWLADSANTSFRVHAGAGPFTARREQQRNGWYWYAYRRVAGRLHKAYLGRDQELTQARLEQVAGQLGAKPTQAAAPPASPALQSFELLATKLHPPPLRPGLVARPRLAQRLAAVLGVPLTIVVAPAGSGKTTLVAAWLQNVERRTQNVERNGNEQRQSALRSTFVDLRFCWLSLDTADNDPARFWAYLAAALDPALPGIAATVAPLLQSSRAIAAVPAQLLNALAAAPHAIVLALDDYHLIEDGAIHEGLALIVDRLPLQVHLVLLSRVDPPLSLARLRARGQLHELRETDLRFTAEETGQFLNRSAGLALEPAAVAALEQRTEGWAAGLQLAALAMRDRADHARFIASFAGSHRSVADYLAEEVIERQPADVQRFLLHTAVLERMCAELCDALLEEEKGRRGEEESLSPLLLFSSSPLLGPSSHMLDYLERANLFLVPLDDERRWYRYHHLFGEMLRDRLRRRDPQRLPLLHQRAAEWYRRAGLINEAVDHALAAEAYPFAADLIEQAVASVLWVLNEVHTLNRWLAAFPSAFLPTRPRLLVAKSWALLAQVKLHDVEQVLRQLEADAEHEPEVRGHIAATRSFLFRLGGDIPAAVAAAHHALEDLPEDDVNIRSLVANNLENAYVALGDIRRAERALAGLDEAHLSAYSFHRLNVMLSRSWMAKARGRLHEAHSVAERALRTMLDSGRGELPSTGLIHVVLAELQYEWNELERAEQHARTALALGGRWWNNDVLVNAYAVLGWIAAARGEPGADALFAETERLLCDYNAPAVAREVASGKARAALIAGRLDEAWRWVEERQFSAEDEPPAYGAGEYIVFARALISQEQGEAALVLLDRLVRRAEAGEYTERLIELHKLRALAYGALGQTIAAHEALGTALMLARPGGYIRTFADEGPPLLRLVRAAVTRRDTLFDNATLGYARRILAASDRPSSSSGGVGPLPDQLTRRELEVLRLLADGLGNQQIAARLHVETSTVRSHVKSIYAKLEATGRVQAVTRARALGLLDA
jgi:LuxR family transcriptional regulator, maltose regulon positive regulatory protein